MNNIITRKPIGLVSAGQSETADTALERLQEIYSYEINRLNKSNYVFTSASHVLANTDRPTGRRLIV